MTRAGLVLLLSTGCQAVRPTPPWPEMGPAHRWVLVERPYEDVECWIQDSGDAELAPGGSTLVFEPVDRLLLESSRCRHRLRVASDVPDRRQVGDPVEVSLWVDCDPLDPHRVEILPTRSGVLPDLSEFHVRGSARVTVRFTADSGGLGGIRAILSEVPR